MTPGRSSGVLSERVRAFLDVARVARVATADADGTPHNVPICPILDEDDVIWFATDETRKTRNIRENPRVCLVYDDYIEQWTDLRQALVFGTAEVIDGTDPRFLGLRDAFYAKFPQYPVMADGVEPEDSFIVRVQIDRVASDGFD